MKKKYIKLDKRSTIYDLLNSEYSGGDIKVVDLADDRIYNIKDLYFEDVINFLYNDDVIFLRKNYEK